MPSSGPRSPASAVSVGTGVAWSNPGNVTASDNSDASASLTSGSPSTQILQAYDFGFSLPSGAIVDGILVEYELASDTNRSRLHEAFIFNRNTSTTVPIATKTDQTTVDGTDTYYSRGSGSDFWGLTGSNRMDTFVNSADFGVGVRMELTSTTSQTPTCDHIRVTLTYTEAAPEDEDPPVSGAGIPAIARVTLSNTATIAIDLPVRRRWSLPAAGQVGDASFVIPHDSPAADPAFVSADGGSLVHIADDDGSGGWDGIVTGIDYREDGIAVSAYQPAVILSHIPVALNRAYRNVPVHVLVRDVFRQIDDASGTFPIRSGPVALGSTLIGSYRMHGESAWSVLLDLMDKSNHEVQVSATGMLSWGRAVTNYPGILLAPSQLRGAAYGVDITEQASRVTVLSDFDWQSVSSGDVAANAHWPAHVVIKQSAGPRTMRELARNELDRRAQPAVTITGSVPREHWGIREGDYLRVLIPWARMSGVTALVRVISREIDAAGELMRLELQPIDETARTRPRQSGSRWMRDIREIQRDERRGRRYLSEAE